MGSLADPELANIFLGCIEEKWVVTSTARPSICFGYVDDTLTLFDSKDTALCLLKYLNSRHNSI